MFNIRIADSSDIKFTCSPKEDVLTSGRRNGIQIPYGCRGGGCGMCKIKVLEGEFSIGISSKAVLPDQEREKNYSLACKTYPLSDLKISLKG